MSRARIHGAMTGTGGMQNLLLDSSVPKTNNNYTIASWQSSEPFVEGEVYTLTARVDLGAGLTGFTTYLGGNWSSEGPLGWDPETGILRRSFTCRSTPINQYLTLYVLPSSIQNRPESTVHWAKLERGAVGTGWTPNPADIETIKSRLTAIEAKNGISYEPPIIDGPEIMDKFMQDEQKGRV